MARISTYPLDTVVVGTDKWIGSDSQQLFATKNFTADAVADFINDDNKVNSQSLQYRYMDYQPTVANMAKSTLRPMAAVVTVVTAGWGVHLM